MEKVKPGDPLRIAATTFNTMIDAARAYRDRQHDTQAQTTEPLPGADVMLVKWMVGTGDCPRCGIIGPGDFVFSPSDNLEGFRNQPIIEGWAPNGSIVGPFLIALEPIAYHRIGRAVVSGLAVCQIEVTDTEHYYADVIGSDFTKLTSKDIGSAEIICRESGTGTKWAVVRLGTGYRFYHSSGSHVGKVLQIKANGSFFKIEWDWVRAH